MFLWSLCIVLSKIRVDSRVPYDTSSFDSLFISENTVLGGNVKRRVRIITLCHFLHKSLDIRYAEVWFLMLIRVIPSLVSSHSSSEYG